MLLANTPAPAEAAEVAAGRRFVEIAATFLVAVSLATIAFYLVRLGPAKLPQQVVRFLLTAGLAYALLQGRTWARWLTVVLCAVGFAGVIVPLGRIAFRTLPILPSLVLLGLALGYGIVARGLLYSASVRAFFAAARPSPPAARGPSAAV
jgi:hypothetical protein